jgi:hypothetical protein
LVTSRRIRKFVQSNPLTPNMQRFRAWHIFGLGCSPFARRYLGNRACFLFLQVLRCFSSLRSPLQPMDSVADVSAFPKTGFPIQKSPDQSLFSSSPRLIAAYHVFHRLLTPRHPPSALNSLATKQLTRLLYCAVSICKLSKSSMNDNRIAVIVSGMNHPASPFLKRDALPA